MPFHWMEDGSLSETYSLFCFHRKFFDQAHSSTVNSAVGWCHGFQIIISAGRRPLLASGVPQVSPLRIALYDIC